MISCPLPACTPEAEAFKQGAGKLGWKAQVLISDFAPDAFISAWESALAQKPNAILYISMFPHDTIKTQLDQAKEAGIRVIESAPAPGIKVGGDSPIAGAIQPEERVALYARIQASLIIEEADSTQGITFMYAKVPSYSYAADEFKKAIEAAGGSVDFLEVSQQDIGTKVPEQVVSYLQRHPDTKYFVAVDDTFLTGVPEAISAAGITAPKLLGSGVPSAQNLKSIKNGQQYATVTGDLATDGWNAVDLLARLSVKEQPENNQPVGVTWVVTKDNVDKFPTVFPGIPDAYTEAWGVS
jgi:ribose transport system substrate-binding protein